MPAPAHRSQCHVESKSLRCDDELRLASAHVLRIVLALAFCMPKTMLAASLNASKRQRKPQQSNECIGKANPRERLLARVFNKYATHCQALFFVARLEGAKPHHKRNYIRAQAGLYCAKDYENETRAVDQADLLEHGGAWQEQVNRQQIRHASMSPHIGIIS